MMQMKHVIVKLKKRRFNIRDDTSDIGNGMVTVNYWEDFFK